jgi:ppGpp synthetase/RelA/SpoT-type nucleotidyltranferase
MGYRLIYSTRYHMNRIWAFRSMKYERYYPNHQARKVFNDILGFRAFCDDYKQVLLLSDTNRFRIADLTSGKAENDGYRGVHVYYQKSGSHYPIEIQFNTLFDRQFNNWLHECLYKRHYSAVIGAILRARYEHGLISNEAEFKEAFKNVLLNCERT